MTRAIVLAALYPILFPASLAAQTAPQPAPQAADPGKTAVLAWLGDVRQKMLSCQQAGEIAMAKVEKSGLAEKLDKLGLKDPADASVVHAAFIPVRDACLMAQRDIQAMQPPASLAGDGKATAGRLLRSCPAVSGAGAQLFDMMTKIADAGDSLEEKQKAFSEVLATGRGDKRDCYEAMRELAQQSGASDAEIKTLITPLSAEIEE